MTKYYLEVETHNKERPYFTIFEFITKTRDIQVGYTLHESIPQAEPEWSPDKFYDWFEAMYFARKYKLELKEINSVEWQKSNSFWALPMSQYEQKWQVRKPQSIDDKLREILTKKLAGNEDKEAVIISTVQAIKDVFKEEK